MKYLIYISTAVRLLSETELKEILIVSRTNNTAKALTGMLLYSEGVFVQLLEGKAEEVNYAFLNISKDSRHKNIITLAEGDLYERNFADWSMGFKVISDKQFEQIEAYFDPFKKTIPVHNIHPAISILKTFAESNKM